ncbi:phage holin family protein [Flavilitoribacter nigricans]|nr:phage holin family protein [Flavilitoribacter nigricans]
MSFEQLLIELGKAHGVKAALSIVLAWLVGHLLPIAGFLAVGVVLVMSDWITGISAALQQKEKITSRGLLRTIRKIIFYCLAIVLVLIVETTFFGSKWIVSMVATYIALVELYSNLENISKITGTNVLAIVREAINGQLKKVNLKTKVPAPSDQLTDLEEEPSQNHSS